MTKRFNQIELFEQRLHGCPKCGEKKSISEFNKRRDTPTGLGTRCRGCQKLGDAKYRSANPEKCKEATRKYRSTNPEKVKDWGKRWREANVDKEKERARGKKRREANPEKIKEQGKKWRDANGEILKSRQCEYRFKAVAKLAPSYLRRLIKDQYGIPVSELKERPDIIELKRKELMYHRIIKNSKKKEL